MTALDPRPADERVARLDALLHLAGVRARGASAELQAGFEVERDLSLADEHRSWLERVNGARVGGVVMLGLLPVTDVLSARPWLDAFPAWQAQGWTPLAADDDGGTWVVTTGPDGRRGWVALVDTGFDPYALAGWVDDSVLAFVDGLLQRELGL